MCLFSLPLLFFFSISNLLVLFSPSCQLFVILVFCFWLQWSFQSTHFISNGFHLPETYVFVFQSYPSNCVFYNVHICIPCSFSNDVYQCICFWYIITNSKWHDNYFGYHKKLKLQVIYRHQISVELF